MLVEETTYTSKCFAIFPNTRGTYTPHQTLYTARTHTHPPDPTDLCLLPPLFLYNLCSSIAVQTWNMYRRKKKNERSWLLYWIDNSDAVPERLRFCETFHQPLHIHNTRERRVFSIRCTSWRSICCPKLFMSLLLYCTYAVKKKWNKWEKISPIFVFPPSNRSLAACELERKLWTLCLDDIVLLGRC